MFYKIPFFEKSGVARTIYGLLFISLALIAFALDLRTKDLIAFDIFYFPSILLMSWYFGGRAGFLTAVMATLMWVVAQADLGTWHNFSVFCADGASHFFIFLFVGGMMNMIRRKAVLLDEKSNELARSNTELEQFAYKAAHDLQSPLATIYGYSEFLMEKKEDQAPDNGEKAQCADAILKSAKRMSAMIKELLNYAKVMKEERNVAPVNLGKVVKEVIETLYASISEKKAEVTADPLPDLPINPSLAAILFQNLIGNAIKYCEQAPRVHISAALKGKEWLFSVQDNGIGVPEADRKRIFVMFEKLTTRQQYPGSGIGLATCQKIVERYHGRIWAESAPGGGSVFHFTFPVN